MFEVKGTSYGKFEALRLINAESGEFFEILKDFGAGINDLQLRNSKGQLVSVIDGYTSENQIIQDHFTAFKGSKLSPYPNRVFNGEYDFNGKKYQLPINEMEGNNSLHAFLHNQPFEVLDTSADHEAATVQLRHSYKGIAQGFPFPYDLSITYRFDQSGVSVTTEIINTGSEDMPAGDGWHPYFQFENINRVKLKIGDAQRVSSNFNNPCNETHGFESKNYVEATLLDDCFLLSDQAKNEISLEDEHTGLHFSVWQESLPNQYKYLQIYTPQNRKSIAIEPVTCPPNGLNTKEGIIILNPIQAVSMSFGIAYHISELNN